MKNKERVFYLVVIFVFFIVGVTQARRYAQNDSEPMTYNPSPNASLSETVGQHGQSIATMTNQMNEIVGNFQKMNGAIQKNEKRNMDQAKLLKDVQNRLQSLEDKMAILTGQLSELKTEGLLKPQTSQRLDEFKRYSRNVEYINAKDYSKAVKGLEEFIVSHPKSPYRSYAQYWVGEAYYQQNDFPMAIKEFQRLLSKDSRSDKAPAAMYKQGLSFMQMQSFEDAKVFFAKVIRKYPQSIEAVQSSSQIRRINRIMDLRKQQQEEMEND